MTKSKGILQRFTWEEDLFLKEYFEGKTLRQLALALGRDMGSVSGRCRFLGLRLSDELKKQRLSISIKNLTGIKSRFEKGHRPWNTGTKGKGICKPNKGNFKKGNIPHNTRFDGATRFSKEGYIEVRISLKKWKFLHRIIWEKNCGPIPMGMIVVFKDKNRLNFDINNLEAITREENMLRNTMHNYPEEIQKVIRLRGQLKRTINKTLKQLEDGSEQSCK
jgi:hypothetical protein